jgi:bla regulator protein blaR1
MKAPASLLFCFAALLQAQASYKFEAVSIKPSDPDSRGMNLNIAPGGGLRARGVTLRGLFEFAYDVRESQVFGMPNWWRTERFDVVATAGEVGDRPDDVRKRAQAMLVERFQITLHHEKQEGAVYFLEQLGPGHKMKTATQEGGLVRNRGLFSGAGSDIGTMAVVLASIVGRPVVDRTGLDGKFDFKVEWSDDAPGKGGAAAGDAKDDTRPSIFTAIREQLGLKLEAGKAPLEVIIVDKVAKPTPN